MFSLTKVVQRSRFLTSGLLILIGYLTTLAECESDCPTGWVTYEFSCYKFVRSTPKTLLQAKFACLDYNAYLLSVNTMEEHSFVIDWLRANDPQHRTWYTSGTDTGTNIWRWDGDNTLVSNLDRAFLPNQDFEIDKKFIAYNYSDYALRWGFLKVFGNEENPYICEIHKDMLHFMIIDERDLEYGLIITDKRKIPRAPKIIKEPEAAIFDISSRQENNAISLKCYADGYPYPDFEWFKEEYENDRLKLIYVDPMRDPRITITDGTLTINKPDQVQDRGKYHCRARNDYGTVVSQSVHLSFGYISQFNLKRSTEQGKENWGKAIYCDPPQHYPEVNFYWSRDYFPNLVDEDKRTFVSKDGNLYFSALENIDNGYYLCNVQNGVSSTGRSGPLFKLEVLPFPSSQQLQFPNNFPKAFPEAPLAGGDVRLECIAFGYPVPSYNWTRKGYTNTLPKNASLSNYNRVLTLPKVSVDDMGDYECTANNGRTSISKTVTLIIQAKPVFTIPLQDMHMDSGGELYWLCEAFGIPQVKYEWLKNGEVLNTSKLLFEDQNRISVRNNVLIIRSLDPLRDPGVYQCRASNQMGVTYSSGQLRVLNLKPSFVKYPMEAETYAVEGSNVTIPCRPEGAPLSTFTWRKDGQMIVRGGRRRILPNGYLVIQSVSQEDAGIYMCLAENSLGRDQTFGRLIVLRKPYFTAPPQIMNRVRLNSTLRLHCLASSEQGLDLAYAWYQNGLRIHPENFGRYSLSDYPGYFNVHNVSFAENGEFECVARTPISSISAKAQVSIEGPPGAPGGLQILAFKDSNIRLVWSDGATNGYKILSYLIEGRTQWNRTWVVVVDEIPAYPAQYGRKETILYGNLLSPWCKYEFRVSARNYYGLGDSSDPSPIHNTDPAPPSRYPSNVGGGGGKVGDLTITWDPLPPQDQNGPGIWYKVFYRPSDSNREPQVVELRNKGNIGMYVVRVGESNYYSPYKVQVQAFNERGSGPISSEVEIYSAENRPNAIPVQISVRAFNSTALNVSWLPLNLSRESIRGKLIGFRIKYWMKSQEETSALFYLSRSIANRALIVGLQPFTVYLVRVSAYNGAGAGAESEFNEEHTYKSAPLKAPNSVTLVPSSPTSVHISWRFSSLTVDEEALMGFKVRYWEADQDFSTYKDVLVPLGQSILEATVSGLIPGKIYRLRVLGYSLGGDGRMSSPALEFKMGGPSPGHVYAKQAAISLKSSVCVSAALFLLYLKLAFLWMS